MKQKLTADTNTGFGSNSNETSSRFYNRDGTPNLVKKGVGILDRYSWYHTLLLMPIWKFLLLIFTIFIIVNIFFAAIYYIIGIDHLGGVNTGSPFKDFVEAFFFSAQTFTTVGYGRINPVGFLASAVAAFEAFMGLLCFAIATGLFYGRFSRPQAFIRFSDQAIIAPYKDISAVMFRIVPYKNNYLTDAEVKLTLALKVKENDKYLNRFYPLELELSKINAFVMNWTIVHPVNETSPLYKMTMEDFKQNNIELLVYVKAFDDAFSNTVISRFSYVADEIVYGAKFKFMYHSSADSTTTIMWINQLSDIEKAELPSSSANTKLDELLLTDEKGT